jgi:hypothetical protein
MTDPVHSSRNSFDRADGLSGGVLMRGRTGALLFFLSGLLLAFSAGRSEAGVARRLPRRTADQCCLADDFARAASGTSWTGGTIDDDACDDGVDDAPTLATADLSLSCAPSPGLERIVTARLVSISNWLRVTCRSNR